MKSFDETYTMRSRFFQLLGEAGKMVANAFREADLENQREIHTLTANAARHSLHEHHGYTFAELPALHPHALQAIGEMNAAELAPIAIAAVQRIGQLGREAGEAIRDELDDGDADFDEGAGWIGDASTGSV